jgi:hypothetical protein
MRGNNTSIHRSVGLIARSRFDSKNSIAVIVSLANKFPWNPMGFAGFALPSPEAQKLREEIGHSWFRVPSGRGPLPSVNGRRDYDMGRKGRAVKPVGPVPQIPHDRLGSFRSEVSEPP